MGNCYLRAHLLEKAVEQYEYAMAIDQHFPSAYINTATIYNELDKYQDSIDIIEEAFRNDVKKPILYCLYGEAFAKTDNKLEAITNFKKAIELDENIAEAYAGLGFIFCEDDDITIGHLSEIVLRAKKFPFSQTHVVEQGAFLQDNQICVRTEDDEYGLPVEDLSLSGKHNLYNTMAAAITAKIMNISNETYATYCQGMYMVTSTLDGTAYSTFKNYPIAVAAKTGTAQSGQNNASDHGAFVCFAHRADETEPDVAIALYGEKIAHGSTLAPVAEKILLTYYEMDAASEMTAFENQAS